MACGGSAPHAATTAPTSASTAPTVTTTPTRAIQPVARAYERRPTPRCEAGDIRALASLTQGIAGETAIASHGDGALVVYRADEDHDGRADVMALALDGQGAPRGGPQSLGAAPGADRPDVVSTLHGYAVVWRETNRVALRNLGENGAPAGPVQTAAQMTGAFGPPAAANNAGTLMVAAVRADTRALMATTNESMPAAAFASGVTFEPDRAPRVLLDGSRVGHVFAMASGGRWLDVPLGSGTPPSEIATSVEHLDARAVTDGVVYGWIARVGAHDTAARVQWLASTGETPPWTVASFRSAFETEVRLLPVAEGVIGAFTVSTLADDAGGALNVSFVDSDGRYLGRQPVVTSLVVRNARVVGATVGDSSWFVFEGRADTNGAPVLGLVPVRCNGAQADPLELPPAGLVQHVSGIDAPPTRIDATTGAAACHADGSPLAVARHVSGVANAVSGTSAAVVSLDARDVVFAVVRESPGAAAQLRVTTVDARGALHAATATMSTPETVLATGAVGSSAIALVRSADGAVARVRAEANGRLSVEALGVAHVTSARLSETGDAFLVGRHGDADDTSLWLAPPRGNAAAVASLSARDEVVDVEHPRGSFVVLLARNDDFGGEVSRALARLELLDRPNAAARAGARLDPFADPLGYGRGAAAWIGNTLVYSLGDVLRAADFDRGELRNLRSVLGTEPRGGAIVASTPGAASPRWFALTSGVPDDEHAARPGPLALAALGARGELQLVTTALPGDREAIAEGASIAAHGDRVAVLYAHASPEGVTEWRLQRAGCRVPPARVAASSGEPARAGGRNR